MDFRDKIHREDNKTKCLELRNWAHSEDLSQSMTGRLIVVQ